MPVADYRQPETWDLLQYRLHASDALLGSEASHVEQEFLGGVSAREPDTPVYGEPVRMEAPGVYPLRPEVDPFYTLAQEVFAGSLRGAKVDPRPIVQRPRPPTACPLPDPETVEPGVGRDVRVVGGYQRNVQAPGVEDPASTQNERVDGVDHVGVKASERASHVRRQGGKLDLRIRRERHAGDPVDRGSRVGAGSLPVLGGDHEHLVPYQGQLIYGRSQARHDTVRRWQESLRDERDPHRACPLSAPAEEVLRYCA